MKDLFFRAVLVVGSFFFFPYLFYFIRTSLFFRVRTKESENLSSSFFIFIFLHMSHLCLVLSCLCCGCIIFVLYGLLIFLCWRRFTKNTGKRGILLVVNFVLTIVLRPSLRQFLQFALFFWRCLL